MRDTQRKRQRHRQREKQQGAQHGTQSRVSRITPWAEGGAKSLSHPGCPKSFNFNPTSTRSWKIGRVPVRILAKAEAVFQSTLTSQKEVAPAPGIEGTQGEAGKDHCCAHEGSGKNAVRGKRSLD